MKKQVKRYGDTLVISFSREEQIVYGIKKGTIVDLGDMVILNQGVKRNGNKKRGT